MFQDNQFSSLKKYIIHSKPVYIVDQHQYVLPLWAHYSLSTNQSYCLVSIDYHPDTNPPFWQFFEYERIVHNKDNSFLKKKIHEKIKKIHSTSLEELIASVTALNNDEHITTALRLNYIHDYHMINCMDEHHYPHGTHYLVSKKHFSGLTDAMFQSINFKPPKEKFILDIDLDFFLTRESLEFNPLLSIFETLVRDAEIITIARSKKYFEYLKKEAYTIKDCEGALLKLIQKILGEPLPKNNI